jgi:hypothetical protein
VFGDLFIAFGFKGIFTALSITLIILFTGLIMYNLIKKRMNKEVHFESIVENEVDTNPFS